MNKYYKLLIKTQYDFASIMHFLLLLPALAACTAGVPLNSTKPRIDSRIFGGIKPCLEQDFSYMLSLHTIGGEFICGAVIISEAWALTAAHCTYDEPNVYVRAGSRRYDKADNEHDVIDKHEHHLFSPTTRDYDIALLKVLPRFRYTRTVGNIPFDEFEVNPGTDAIVSGWGFTETDGDYSDDLLFRVIPTIDKSKCEEYFPGKITPRMMCAGDTDGIGICEGDSGGPLVANGKLVGIVSWRADPCGSGVPDVYTKIAAVRGWISGISGV